MSELTQERVRELFDYNPDSGELIRRNGVKWAKPGPVGSAHSKGYLTVGVDSKLYYVHRIIMLWVYGEFPKDQTDHIDGNKTNNRIENLRAVSGRENQRNNGLPLNNTSGRVGVYWSRTLSKWAAQITVKSKGIYLGIYSNKADAILARERGERKYGFRPNPKRSRQRSIAK